MISKSSAKITFIFIYFCCSSSILGGPSNTFSNSSSKFWARPLSLVPH